MEPALPIEEEQFPVFQNLKTYGNVGEKEQFKHYTKVEFENIKDEYGECIPILLFVFDGRIVFAKEQIESKPETIKENPVLKSIKYSHICIYNLIVKDNERTKMFLNHYTEGYLKREEFQFTFVSHKDSYCIHHLIKKYFILNWQKYFEETILKDYVKCIYNRHYILIKYNRFRKMQERTLLITNLLIFNVEHNYQKNNLDFQKKNVKWACAIKAIKKIAIIKDKEKELRMHLDKIKNQAEVMTNLKRSTELMKFKDVRDFEFFSMEERNDFIAILRMNYYNLTKNYLAIEFFTEEKEK